MRTVAAGGWVSTTALADHDAYPFCTYCRCLVTLGWLHVPTGRVVCVGCLPDPRAEVREDPDDENSRLVIRGVLAARRLAEFLWGKRDDDVVIY